MLYLERGPADNDQGGVNDVEAGTKAVLAASGGILPQISAGGELRMTLHQINANGAGPYTCLIDSTGTGTQWQQIQVTKNVPGRRGRNAQGVVTDFVSGPAALHYPFYYYHGSTLILKPV